MYADLLVQTTSPGFTKTSPAVFKRRSFLSASGGFIGFWLADNEPVSWPGWIKEDIEAKFSQVLSV